MPIATRSASALRSLQSFGATTPKGAVRRLHVTGGNYQPSQWLKPLTAEDAAGKPKRASSGRAFNTSRALKTPNDSSTVDFTFLPSLSSFDAPSPSPSSSVLSHIPILPDHYRENTEAAKVAFEPVVVHHPEVSTVSMQHEGQLSVMSESHDSGKHAEQMDVFGLVEGMGSRVKEGVVREVGVVRQVWEDLMDDLLGKKTSRA